MTHPGYLYIRSHASYDQYDACKLGITMNIPERDSVYSTGEIKRGFFAHVVEIPFEQMKQIEGMLKKYFTSLGFNVKYDGGTEFFKKDIMSQIVPYLEKININFKVLSKEEIENLLRTYRIRNIKEKLRTILYNLRIKRTKSQIYIPRADQTIIVNDSVTYFKTHDKGMLILMCGVGKTLISLWITQQLDCNKVIIGVPNKLLLKQWEKVIGKLFPESPVLCVSGGVSENDIQHFLEKSKDRCIVITTYSSSHKVNAVSKCMSFTFDMKIQDEVHHLTSQNLQLSKETKTYIHMLDIPSKKQLSLTATIKQLDCMGDDDNVVSNDNIEQFGEIIDRKCLLWAIQNNIVCDYVIQTILTNEDQFDAQLQQFNITDENDKRLFLSAYASLKSINDGHSHHLLIYSNNKDNSSKLIQFVKMLLDEKYFELPELYYSNYHSEMNTKEQNGIITKFESTKQGIITCVYCLGEGWDFPLLDAVVFGENMSSNIRIVQSALRASRKNRDDPHKKTKIILPILNRDDWLEDKENVDLKKVREVIYQMGLEDETISQKIQVSRLPITKPGPHPLPKPRPSYIEEFGEYDDELTQKLRLKTTSRNSLGTTYEKARKIMVEKHVKSKEAYLNLCERDIRLPKDPETVFKAQFTTWFEFLSNSRDDYYDLETCKKKVSEYVCMNPELQKHYLDLDIVCSQLCKLDNSFPAYGLWVDCYRVKDLCDIITISPKKKKITSHI
jgi:superfamily II DNA or RNA helicase